MDYGLVTEAQRDHLSMTVYNGGGYVNLATQVSQMDDCIAAHYNAIIVGAIDATGLNPQIAKAHAAGIPVFDIANGIDDAIVAGHARVSFDQLGLTAATELLQHNKGKQMNILEVPGPEGAVWSDEAVQGIQQGVATDPDAKIVGIRRGDTDSTTTIGLIEDGLKAYPQTNAIITFDSGAGVAVTAVRDLGLTGKVQVAGFMIVPADWTDIAQGTLLGCPTDFTPILGRIAVDMAVRTLQHQPLLANSVSTFPVFITEQTMKTVNESDIFAPSSFKYVFTVNG
jgi:periplasmic protein TorT